jgi:hypothetical protein
VTCFFLAASEGVRSQSSHTDCRKAAPFDAHLVGPSTKSAPGAVLIPLTPLDDLYVECLAQGAKVLEGGKPEVDYVYFMAGEYMKRKSEGPGRRGHARTVTMSLPRTTGGMGSRQAGHMPAPHRLWYGTR